MIRTLIVDDEPYARKGLRVLLAENDRFEVIGEAGSGEEAVVQIQTLQPDLVFLDVQMPDMDGFQVLENLPISPPRIVFVTAYDEYAVRAFEVSAVDYLLKPVAEDRFESCLLRVLDQLARESQAPDVLELLEAYRDALSEPALRVIERLSVPTREGHRVLEVSQIDWIEAQDYYSALHVGPTTHLVRESMSRLAAQLDPKNFVRIHRSTILHLDRLQSIETPTSGDVQAVLVDGTRRRVSRSGFHRLKQVLPMLR